MTRRLLIAAALATLTSAACSSNQPGDRQSLLTGDVTRLAPRAPFDAEMLTACGSGDLTPAGDAALRRPPYLQRVTSSSAMLLWTQATFDRAIVEVTTPTGALVATVVGKNEKAVRSRGGYQFRATLPDLAPRQMYCYQLSIDGKPVIDRTGFRTAPAAGSGAPVRIAAWGDSGWEGDDQNAIVDGIESVPFDLMIHMGDIAYTSGTLAQFEDTFFVPYGRLLRNAPMFPVSGNHEYETDDAWPYRQVFALPENGGPAGVERWFSFDWGDVHLVALDTEQIGSEQAVWLDKDLAANQLPWVIVYLHRPPFSSGEHGSDGAVRRWFVPLFEKHAVPLVLAGHDHHYERIRPQNGVHYIVSGGGGRGTRPVGRSAFTAFSESVLNFLFLQIEGDVLTVHAIDGTGREFDSLRIERPRPGTTPVPTPTAPPAETTAPGPTSPQHETPRQTP